MLDAGNVLGLVGVIDKDHTWSAGRHSNIAWVTDSSISPHLGQ